MVEPHRWTYEETLLFLELGYEHNIEKHMERKSSLQAVRKIKDEMEALGYHREIGQLVVKWRNLKVNYKRFKTKSAAAGRAKDSFQYMQQIERIIERAGHWDDQDAIEEAVPDFDDIIEVVEIPNSFHHGTSNPNCSPTKQDKLLEDKNPSENNEFPNHWKMQLDQALSNFMQKAENIFQNLEAREKRLDEAREKRYNEREKRLEARERHLEKMAEKRYADRKQFEERIAQQEKDLMLRVLSIFSVPDAMPIQKIGEDPICKIPEVWPGTSGTNKMLLLDNRESVDESKFNKAKDENNLPDTNFSKALHLQNMQTNPKNKNCFSNSKQTEVETNQGSLPKRVKRERSITLPPSLNNTDEAWDAVQRNHASWVVKRFLAKPNLHPFCSSNPNGHNNNTAVNDPSIPGSSSPYKFRLIKNNADTKIEGSRKEQLDVISCDTSGNEANFKDYEIPTETKGTLLKQLLLRK